MKNKRVYIIRKYVVAKSAKQAIQLEKSIDVSDCWLEETSQRKMIDGLYEEPCKTGFQTKKK